MSPRDARLTVACLAPVVGLIWACGGPSQRGPLQEGDTSLARHSIQSFTSPADGEPPPPPIDTLAEMRVGETTADLADVKVRVRYYLDDNGERGWIAFPPGNQPPGVSIDSTTRIIIHGKKIGGAGVIRISTASGTIDVDLGRHITGDGTVIAGKCKKDESQVGACATVSFNGIQYTPAGGQPSTRTAKLEVGVPAQ